MLLVEQEIYIETIKTRIKPYDPNVPKCANMDSAQFVETYVPRYKATVKVFEPVNGKKPEPRFSHKSALIGTDKPYLLVYAGLN